MDPGVIDSTNFSRCQKNLPKVLKLPKETNLYTYISKNLLKLPNYHIYAGVRIWQSIFIPGMMKNRIHNMGIKKATQSRCLPFTRALEWPSLYLPCCVLNILFPPTRQYAVFHVNCPISSKISTQWVIILLNLRKGHKNSSLKKKFSTLRP